MKRIYDLVYLTNTPSFYKLNLCNELARYHSVLLVLYGYGSEAVNTELNDRGRWRFDYEFINTGDSNRRSKLHTFVNLLKLMRRISAKKILYSGWMAPEYNLYSIFSPRHKNVVICESSILDVNISGISGLVKKMIIGRMGASLPSGRPHEKLFNSIGYKGHCNITGSVGIFNKPPRIFAPPHNPLRYLYVGRLVNVKNVELLIELFNKNGKPLTIVGTGPLEKILKSRAKDNIIFTGFIDNEKLGEIYQSHDVFILPSYYEPWGLVVEEALYWGLPVIVSNRIGSSEDMVRNLGTGEIFKSQDAESLEDAINLVENDYESYRKNVMEIDWAERDARQIKAYTMLLDSDL